MKFPTQTIDAYNAVKPESVLTYLQQNGWSKREDFSDAAQIWVHPAQENRFYEVLLPITTEIPDYASRMDDVFRILELAEQRPQTEIFNDLVDVQAIAAASQREILNLHFQFAPQDFGEASPLENRPPIMEASAKHLGGILESLQALFDSLGQVKASRPSPFGKVAKEITDQTRLSVLGTFKGSFGLRLALAPQLEQPIETTLGELVIQEFLEILHQTHDQSREQLSERLGNLQRRSISNYRKFLLSLLDASADLRVDWGSLKPQQGGSAIVTSADARVSVDAIKKIEVDAPQEYQLTGELLAASKSSKIFEIRNMDDDCSLSGKMTDEIIQSGEVELTLGKLYDITLREQISVSQVTGEGKIERVMIGIRAWHS
jgi:hypothetical protein